MKKNTKNRKLKIISIVLLSIILSIGAYIYQPNISRGLETVLNNIVNAVGKINIPANKVTMNKEQIHEHRGYSVIATSSSVEKETYEQAVGKTGISDIQSYINKYMSPSTGDCAIGSEPTLGWVGSLLYNTSIFCQEKGTPFPGLKARVFNGFHAQKNSNRDEEGTIIQDYIEWCPPLACSKKLTIYLEDYKDDGVILRESKMSEADVYYTTNFKYVMGDFQMYTSTRVDYKASSRNFDTPESYIYTYSLRNYYTSNPAQAALWRLKNGTPTPNETSRKLFNSAKAVEELCNPTKPKMSKTTATNNGLTYSTGTVLDGNNYKIGPIKMNGYSYGWTEDIKEFSGQSSVENPKNATILANKSASQIEFFKGIVAGIIEAKVKLDNGKEIILDKDNFIIEGGSTNSGSSYYSYPTMADGYEYPTPNSTFYIILPISECVDATMLEKMTMTYKWHTADGYGGDLDGYYQELKWEPSGTLSLNSSTTYHCDNSYGGYECVHDSLSANERSCYYGYGWDDYNVNQNAHAFWCGKDGYCFDGKSGQHRHCGGACKDCYGHQGSRKCNGHHSHSTACCSITPTHAGHTCNYSSCTNGGIHSQHTSSCCSITATPHANHTCNTKDCSYDGIHTNHTSSCCSKTPSHSDHTCNGLDCDYGGTHTWVDWSSANRPGCYNTDYCDYADLNYCLHGHADGKHDGSHSWSYATHIHDCYGPDGVGTRCNAHKDADGGGHRNCATFKWKCTKKTATDVQKLVYVTDAQVYEHNEECYIENIPLVTKVEIDKYIMEVKHENEQTPYFTSNARKDLEDDVKKDNPVYVETEDFVTYKLVLTNHSAFGVKVRADDILPEESSYKFISAYLGGTKINNIKDLRKSIIQINANSEASITITIQVMANDVLKHDESDEYENIGRIITRNGHQKDSIDAEQPKDVDYVRTVDDDGPVVNHEDVKCNGTTNEPDIESSDWFKLNNYNAFIDKYVYKYDEKVLKDNNNVLGITKESSIVDADGKLLQEVNGKDVSRRNVNKTTTTVNDGNVDDIVRTDNGAKEKYKEEHPVNVEKTEKITYAIRVSNEAKEIAKTEPTGTKPATQLKNIRVEDKLHEGLKYTKISAKIYEYVDGGEKDKFIKDVTSISCSGSTTVTDGYRTYYITALSGKDDILEPNQYIEFYMETTVVQSNMYLDSMSNSAELTAASNVNDVVIYDRDGNIDRMISEQTASKEFVRMKDLLISGKVWLDIDKNGLMDDKARSELDKINNNINNNAMKENVLVRLYRVEGDKATEIRRTRTDENGLYTFARKEGTSSWYGTFNNTVNYEKDAEGVNGGKYQRIDKASGKDANGNYTSGSQYYSYYVEFEYDGVLYKSTEIYAGMDNLTQNDGRYNANYLIDSNAAELEVDRDAFNKRYEYISYNVAYDMGMNKSGDLVFQKDGHSSYLMEDPSRDMTAKSFVLKYDAKKVLDACKLAMNSCGSAKWKQCSNHWDDWQVVIAMGLIDESKYPNTTAGRKDAQAYLKTIYNTLSNNAGASGNTQMIKYLWLYSFNEGVDNTIPETDYLKYINLGLELREDVDLALTKDVYNLKTTINGEEMEYDYNLGNTGEYLNDYIVKKPYGFEIYESDYKYRVEQYIAKAVEAYKGANGEDELNVEVTYRINLKNIPTTDDDSLPNAKDTKLYARVHEVLDLYDENFMEYTKDAIKVKVKNAEGFLEDKEIKVAEAWMFMKKSEAGGKELLEGGQTYKERTTSGEPIYVKDDGGEFVKVKLQMSNTSKYSAKTNNFKSDGYNTAYITGMGDKVLAEGEDFDIYVKYVVDKAKLEIEVSETYNETQTVVREAYSEETEKVETVTMTNDNITAVITNIIESTVTDGGATKKVTTAEIDRAIKLKDNREDTNPYKKQNGRGTENIAQIDAYSIWYDKAGTDPASLVDKDSNAGNIGIKNTSTNKSPNGTGYSETTTSADDIEFYEDMTYKTGIELAAEGTEQTRDEIEETYQDRLDEEVTIIKVTAEYDPIRKITGKVWDDSRTDKLGSGNEIQYIGDGIYDTSKTKIAEAKENKNVELNYKDESVTEAKDIAVRNAKAEFIEIVQTDANHFYEEVLTNVTWDQVQNARTDENGFYMLEGFKPGRYIVRFTYGDVESETVWDKLVENDKKIEELENRTELSEKDKYNIQTDILKERNNILESEQFLEVKDMLIFNGQDYKSTKYTGVTDDLSDVDKVIEAFEKEGVSDARDDEARRLEVNAYSEVMTNEMAEILKGLVNGNETLTPNSTVNSSEELKALTDNTYMQADTREFTVKAEKLVESTDVKLDQKGAYKLEFMFKEDSPYYKYLTALKNEHINARNFTIENVDLGIEYRPESQISLMKEIKEITLTTEDGEVLVNLHFRTIDDGSDRKHEIIKEDSTGYELVQFITNNYVEKTLINNVMSEESLQGLVYIQVDEEILQGCTIEITYGFEAQNSSEIDRIRNTLNAIRYRDNKATDDLITSYNDKYSSIEHKKEILDEFKDVMNTKYTASGLANAAVYLDTYAIDDQNLLYREIPKTTTKDGNDGYYGRYVGYGYYVGKVSNLDTISVLKFDKILDYIDTNLEYEQKTNAEEMVNKLWSRITSKELVGLVSHYKGYRNADEATIAGIKVTNIEGVEYKSMVVSVDDRNVDPGDPNDTEPVKNQELSRFLLPKVSVVGINGKDNVGSPEYEKYTGHIYLDVSKVLAAGSDADDKTYENMAEIVQFTTLNGRRTNFATTIGNADIKSIKQKLDEKLPPFENIEDNPNSGSVEFITASIEPDTSATETITLIPPTGLMRSRRPIVTIMEATKKTVEVMSIVGLVVAIIAGITVAVVFTIRKKQTKRVK